jgi:hypothetical protein
VKILEVECLDLQAALEAEGLAENNAVEKEDLTEADVHITIRDGGRGRPIVEGFVQHVRCLMATGSSSRSCREQLLLNAGYFLHEEVRTKFMDEVPKVRWFNKQREGLANEAYLYALTRLAKCEAVEQWGFDETSLDGVPSVNQWCRIREGEAYVVVTLECGGLLQGSSAQKIAQHVQRIWERGQEAIGILRRELGEEADTLVPLVNGGINFSKLRGVMHDTCNTANKVATLARVQRDTCGKAFFGEEEWAAMQEHEVGWQDFLCGNHTRNLPVDAFNRRFDGYLKQKFGPELDAAKYRGGGYTRIEPSGQQFIRSICKLTHTGRKQYAKGKFLLLLCRNLTLSQSLCSYT